MLNKVSDSSVDDVLADIWLSGYRTVDSNVNMFRFDQIRVQSRAVCEDVLRSVKSSTINNLTGV